MGRIEAGREEERLSKAGEHQGREQGQKSQSPAQEGKASVLERGLWVGGAGDEAGNRLWRLSPPGVGL